MPTPSASACLDDDIVAEFIAGLLPPVDIARVDDHLASCRQCGQLVAQLAGAVAGVMDGAPLEVGVGADRFEVLELIGEGGMGSVYRGLDRLTGAAVAVKQLKASLLTERPAAVRRFARESAVLGRLAHPNIVKIIASIDCGEVHRIVMEFVPGGSLRGALQAQGPWPMARVAPFLLELSDALARAHHLGVVHRDIKPENVLLAADGTPRLADFGLALLVDQQASTSNALAGTLPYLSPEALSGGTVDQRADLWALGVMSFEMLTGQRPFCGDTPAAVIAAILLHPLPDLRALRPELTPDVVSLIQRLLARDPAERPTARQLGAGIESFWTAQRAAARALQAGALTVGASTIASPPAPRASAPRAPAPQLPVELTPFIGRQAELAQLERLMLDPVVRLLTIVGPGGMGKSRLASEAGQRLASGHSEFQDGIFWVELVPLASASLIASAMGEQLGYAFSPRGDRERQLLEYLRDKKSLFVLDNFEHLLKGAPFIDELLRAAPGIKVLATSRQPLGLRVERQLVLSGLSLPESGDQERLLEHAGVQLFVEGARRLRVDFEPSHADLQAIARIGRLAEGMPLALLLAASWTSLLSLPEIAEELRAGVDLLEVQMSDVPERQRSLRAVFEHSWKLLGKGERRVFAALSVFRGGFTRSAAASVAHATLADLANLHKQSLLWRGPKTNHHGVHELLRQYAEVKLSGSGEDEATRDRHASYYAQFLRQREADLRRADSGRSLNEIDAEIDNVRAAWRWLILRQQLDQLQGCIEALNLYYRRRGPLSEAAEALGQAASLTHSVPFTPEHARLACLALRMQANFTKDYPKAAKLAAEALRLLPEQVSAQERASVLLVASTALGRTGQLTQALVLGDQALQLLRGSEGRAELAHALGRLAVNWIRAGEYDRAKGYYREGLALVESHADSAASFADLCIGLGWLLVIEGDSSEGRRWLMRALEVAERQGDALNEAGCLARLADLERGMGRYREAAAYAARCLKLSRRLDHPVFAVWALQVSGNIHRDQAQFEAAAAQYAESELEARQNSDLGGSAFTRLAQGELALARADHGAAQQHLSESLRVFQDFGIQIGELMALGNLGMLACYAGEYGTARAFFDRALETKATRALPALSQLIAGIGLWYARTERPERAVELLTLIDAHRATECQYRVRYIEPLLHELESTLGEARFVAARARGKALDLEAVRRSLLEQLRADARTPA